MSKVICANGHDVVEMRYNKKRKVYVCPTCKKISDLGPYAQPGDPRHKSPPPNKEQRPL